jgi:hypothetical protein
MKRPVQDMGLSLLKTGKGKGEAIPLQALTGPDGSRRLRLPGDIHSPMKMEQTVLRNVGY